jgi:hypothetical protein
MDPFSIPQMIYESVWSKGGMIMTEKLKDLSKCHFVHQKSHMD